MSQITKTRTSISFPPGKAMLRSLPPEIFWLITSHLPHSGMISLSQTCQAFYYSSPVFVEDLFDRNFSPSESQERCHDQRMFKEIIASRGREYARQSTIDQARSLFCSVCQVEHKISAYSMAALRGSEERRRCMIEEGLLWNCPSKIWTFEQALAVGWGDKTSQVSVFEPGGLCICNQRFTSLWCGFLTHAFPIDVLDSQASMTAERVSSVLENVHVRICPHTSMSEIPYVMECAEAPDAYCGICRTKIRFKHHNVGGKVILYLLVRRWLGEWFLNAFKKSAWEQWSFLPAEIKRLTEEWHTYPLCQIADPDLRRQVLSPHSDPFKEGGFTRY